MLIACRPEWLICDTTWEGRYPLAMLTAVHNAYKRERTSLESARHLYDRIAQYLRKNVAIKSSSATKEIWKVHDMPYFEVCHSDTAKVVAQCMALDQQHHVEWIVDAWHKQVERLKGVTLAQFLASLVQEVAAVASDFNKSCINPSLGQIVVQLLDLFRERYVGEAPSGPTERPDWNRRARGCRACEHCKLLDKYLRNSNERFSAFQHPKHINDHLEAFLLRALSTGLGDLKWRRQDSGHGQDKLRITKMDRHGNDLRRDWEDRRDIFIAVVNRIDADVATNWLGEQYDHYSKTKHFEATANVEAPNPLINEPGSSALRNAGSDRRHDLSKRPLHTTSPNATEASKRQKSAETNTPLAHRDSVVASIIEDVCGGL